MSDEKPRNLMQGLTSEIQRNQTLKQQFVDIGPAGSIGARLIQLDIDNAFAAINSGDVVEMLHAYQTLQANDS